MSTAAPAPRAPAGLDAAGKSLWRRINRDFELGVLELELLGRACRQADDIALLEAVIDEHGLHVKGSTGQTRLRHEVTEVRLARQALAKLLAQLDLPAEEHAPVVPRVDGDDNRPPQRGRRVDRGASRRAKRAADKRWGKVTPIDSRKHGHG